MSVKNFIVPLLLLSTVHCKAQMTYPEDLKEIQKQLLAAPAMTYDYAIEQRSEDGTILKTKGKFVKGKNFISENNSEQQVIQNEKWYYKLDHSSKTIFIIDLAKVNKTLYKDKPQSTAAVAMIPDSIVLRYGKLDIKKTDRLLKVKISFSPEVLIREIYLEYDSKNKVPLLYKVQMKVLYGIDGWQYEEKYLDQTLTANNFQLKANEHAGDISDYFSYKDGKIKLKQYAHYKLIQQI